MKRWIKRIALAVLAIVLVACGWVAYDFLTWRSAGRALFATNSRAATVVTTARGPVEYAEVGSGRPVLQIHGSPGGFDNFYVMHRMRYGADGPPFRAILPSRPGYLRTPLTTGKTHADQADAMAALLDVIGVRRVAVIGVSDGGPSALQFALRHPERCSSLVLVSGVVHKIPDGEVMPPAIKLVYTVMPKDFLTWVFSKLLSGGIRKEASGDTAAVAMAEAMMTSMVPFAQREEGTWNDVANDKQIRGWPLRDIRCPTLVIHGTADTSVPISHGDSAAAQIPGAKFVRLEGADHLAFLTRRKEVDAAITAFLAEHPDSSLPRPAVTKRD